MSDTAQFDCPKGDLGGLIVMTSPSEHHRMLTPSEVADRCQLSTKTLLRAIRRGDLRASQLGACRAFRIRSEDVDAWIAAKIVLPPLSASFRLPRDGRLVITSDNGRHGHRAPDATA